MDSVYWELIVRVLGKGEVVVRGMKYLWLICLIICRHVSSALHMTGFLLGLVSGLRLQGTQSNMHQFDLP